jgi:hypothetical protein
VLEIPPDKERDCMKWAIDIGADAVQIDHPEMLKSLIDEMRRSVKGGDGNRVLGIGKRQEKINH